VEKDRGNFCWKPRVFTRFRVDDEDDDKSDIRLIQSTSSQPITLRFILVLF
jgi:hypothetical protein